MCKSKKQKNKKYLQIQSDKIISNNNGGGVIGVHYSIIIIANDFDVVLGY